MSQWTHVNASIRFDGFSFMKDTMISEKDLGQIINYDYDGEWDTKLPLGSEGSIEYTIVTTGSASSVANRAVVFTGDLRDYDDWEFILNYFNSIVEGRMIRSGVLEIDVEGQDSMVFAYSDDTEQFEKLNYK